MDGIFFRLVDTEGFCLHTNPVVYVDDSNFDVRVDRPLAAIDCISILIRPKIKRLSFAIGTRTSLKLCIEYPFNSRRNPASSPSASGQRLSENVINIPPQAENPDLLSISIAFNSLHSSIYINNELIETVVHTSFAYHHQPFRPDEVPPYRWIFPYWDPSVMKMRVALGILPNWMSRMYPFLSNLSLKDICLCGAHNAAITDRKNVVYHNVKGMIVAQKYSISELLHRGCRYFDIRPIAHRTAQNGVVFYCGHYSFEKIPMYGLVSLGLSSVKTLLEIIEEINDFTETHNELIVLAVSHCHQRWDGHRISAGLWVELMDILKKLKNVYIPPLAPLLSTEAGSANNHNRSLYERRDRIDFDVTSLPLYRFLGCKECTDDSGSEVKSVVPVALHDVSLRPESAVISSDTQASSVGSKVFDHESVNGNSSSLTFTTSDQKVASSDLEGSSFDDNKTFVKPCHHQNRKTARSCVLVLIDIVPQMILAYLRERPEYDGLLSLCTCANDIDAIGCSIGHRIPIHAKLIDQYSNSKNFKFMLNDQFEKLSRHKLFLNSGSASTSVTAYTAAGSEESAVESSMHSLDGQIASMSSYRNRWFLLSWTLTPTIGMTISSSIPLLKKGLNTLLQSTRSFLHHSVFAAPTSAISTSSSSISVLQETHSALLVHHRNNPHPHFSSVQFPNVLFVDFVDSDYSYYCLLLNVFFPYRKCLS